MNQKRAAVLMLTDPEGIVDADVVRYAEQLKAFCGAVYAVFYKKTAEDAAPDEDEEETASAAEESDETFKLVGCTDRIIDCSGCDTRAGALRRTLLQEIGRETLEKFDELILTDDSFFGMLRPLESVFADAEKKDGSADFWGLSCMGPSDAPLNVCVYKQRPWHVRTEFLVIRKRLLHDAQYWAFWEAMGQPATDAAGRELYDYTFTRHFTDLGFSALSLFDTAMETSLAGRCCLNLLRDGFPYLSKAVFLQPYEKVLDESARGYAAEAIALVKERTDYPADLIYDCVVRRGDPYRLSAHFGLDFVVSRTERRAAQPAWKAHSAAFVMHLHYPETFDINLACLSELPESIDLFVTVTSEEKKAQILEKLPAYPRLDGKTEVLVSDGNGRDLGALLVEARPRLAGYEYFGFTHDRTPVHQDAAAGQGHQSMILDSIIGSGVYAENALGILAGNPRLGLLVVPRSEYARDFSEIGRRWAGNYKAYAELMEKIGLPANGKPGSTPMTAETAFWCRRDALQGLFGYEWTHEDFHEEPLPLTGTVNHALARALPYLAAQRGYLTGTLYSEEAAAAYLTNRGYTETAYFTAMNKRVKMNDTTLSSYISRTNSQFVRMNSRYRWSADLKNRAASIRRRAKLVAKSKYFDKKWYVRTYPEAAAFAGNPAEYYMVDGWKKGQQPSTRFSNEEYLRLNPDVAKNRICPLLHYEQTGKDRVRVVERSEFFDAEWYAKTYPEYAQYNCTPAEHSTMLGWREGKDPSPRFSTNEYFAINMDVRRADMNPLFHYERYGRKKHRKYKYDAGDYRPHTFWRGLKRKAASIVCRREIRQNQNARILVILHLFYMVSWKEIQEYLKNLEAYHYDLVITYMSNLKDEKVFEQIRAFKPDVVLRECENAGFDVIPYIEAVKDIDLDKYDVIFKLQSKGVMRYQIFIYNQFMQLRDWFLNLYEGCIGAFTVHRTIAKLMDPSKKVGIVAAKNLLVVDPQHKQNMVRAYMNENGIPIPDKYLYVAGTCFAARTEVVRPLKDLHYDMDEIRNGGKGFTVAHKLERVICLLALSMGYDMEGNDVLRLRRWWRNSTPTARNFRRYSALRLLDDDRFTLDDEFVFFSLERRKIKDYEVIDLPLGEIKRRWLKKIIPLSECHPYKYLVTGDPAVYEEYRALNQQYYGINMMSRERFDELIQSIDENGFDEKSMIVVDENNVILDGQHRCCYMLYRYGANHKIPVVRLHEIKNTGLGTKLKDGAKSFLQKHAPSGVFNGAKQVYGKLRRLLHR